jgi:ribosomal protein L40E
MLEQMYLSQCENVDIWEISGQLPNFIACRIDASKYVKFKGEISGNIGLQSLEFDHALRSEIFQQPTYLPYLTRLVIQNGSNFFKLNLEKLKAPQLKVLELRDSNYVNIESMGEIAPQLTKFSFENCSYPKLNIDFKKLSQLSHQTALDSDEGDCVSVFNPNVFRKVKSVRKKKKLSRIAREIYTDPNSPDLELYKSTLSVSDATTQANAFLDRSNSTNSTNILLAKFCPECGTKNPQTATFCSQCGSKFPKIG